VGHGQQKCVYCGETDEIGSDHIPPKNLFPKPRPNDLITVPCCRKCNDAFSKDDEHFRTIIACTAESAQHPEAQRLWEQKIFRLLQRKCPVIPELIRQSFGSSEGVTESQIHDAELRVAGTIVRIVKGLYFEEMGASLPVSHEVKINLEPNFLDCGGLDGAICAFEHEPGSRGQDIGDGVFRYRMAESLAKQGGTAWLLVFFECLPFLCTSAPRLGGNDEGG